MRNEFRQNLCGKTNKPELLLPVGSPESFYAAIDGGADAIYLGLNVFNARNRAKNFTPRQLAALVKFAHARHVKCHITLNTLVKNGELSQLANALWQLQQIKPDAVIVQDLGVLYLAKRFFPNLKIHASTQMGIHNSEGVNFLYDRGVERVVLARELTKPEIEQIAKKSRAELELFIHGALCYSFSGMCLFSSYIGGASANRGLCSQPCRRIYVQEKKDNYFFCLKDNQQLDNLQFFKQNRIASLKVEGRLKSAEYVFRTASAYRMALDNPGALEKSGTLLKNDFGREKTSYFLGGDVSEAITQNASAGLIIGHVISSADGRVVFDSSESLPANCRLRFRNKQNDEQITVSVSGLKLKDGAYVFKTDNAFLKQGFEVYQAGQNNGYPSKIEENGVRIDLNYPSSLLKKLLAAVGSKKSTSAPKLYVRIDDPKLLDCLGTGSFDLILSYGYAQLEELLKADQRFLKSNKLHVELPKFISEKDLNKYRSLLEKLARKGVNSFFISQIYQKQLLPNGSVLTTNENVYLLNDAAIQFVRSEKISDFVYPFENDIVNLSKTSDRSGIVPLFYYPELFFSRMPVKIDRSALFSDKMGQKYRKFQKSGITIVVPEKAVSLTQYASKLSRYGYNRYLIDLKYVEPSKKLFGEIISATKESRSVQMSSTAFNFKRELK